MLNKYIAYRSEIINPLSDSKTNWFKDGLVILKLVGDDYLIKEIGHYRSIKKLLPKDCDVIELNGVMMPGFYDMHFHWVQDDVREMPKDSLLNWLMKYTFPTEMKFKSKRYTQKRVKEFTQKLLSRGTIGGACYSSLHTHSTSLALDSFIGDYIVGNVLMTMNSPKGLNHSQKIALEGVKELSKKYKNRYALTPRFAITTDPDTMKKSSQIVKAHGSFKQTHLSETENEIETVLNIYSEIKGFEKVPTYTEIYNKVGMLDSNTIMGHGIYLSDKELQLLSRKKVKIAHCPTSNAPKKEKGLGSGLFDFKRADKFNVDWSLASDIGGGPFLSMFDVMRSFVEQNKKAKRKGATYKKALYRSTLKGAEHLRISRKNGNLLKNKFANFITVKAPKKSHAKNVEERLAELVKPGQKKRKYYDSIVKSVYYRGHSKF